MVDVLVCGASVYETQFVSMKAATLVTGPNNAYAAATLTASLFHEAPWNRPKLIIGVGMASRLNNEHQIGSTVVPSEVSLWPQGDDTENADELRELGMSVPGDIRLSGEGARMASGDVLLTGESEAKENMLAHGYSLYDVGGYGVAVAARYANIPCALVRIVTDEGNGSSVAERQKHLSANAKALGEWVASLRDRLR